MKTYGKHAQQCANRIIEAFKHPGRLPKALAPLLIHRDDDVPCRRWSWHNQLLVALSGTADARGFRQWQQVSRQVKKGSKALYILAPCTKRVRKRDDDGTEKSVSVVVGFKAIAVFAKEDTDGEAVPEVDTKYADWVRQLPLIDVAESWGINVDTYSHAPGVPLGYYQSSSNGNQAIMLGDERLTTWLHELVHAAEGRLGVLRDGEKWQREVVAEFGSAILMEILGVESDRDLGGAYEYIAMYAGQTKMPVVRACIQVLERTCNATQLILNEAQGLVHSETFPVSLAADA